MMAQRKEFLEEVEDSTEDGLRECLAGENLGGLLEEVSVAVLAIILVAVSVRVGAVRSEEKIGQINSAVCIGKDSRCKGLKEGKREA
jgi:hypothetical protein